MKTSKLLLIIPAVAVLAACSRQDADPQTSTRISFFSNVLQTKSANVNLQKTQIASGVEVGVFVNEGNSSITDGDNTKLTADGNGGFTGTSLYFPTSGSAVSVYAYAPYNAAFTGKVSEAVPFSVAADQSTDAGYLASDLLWGVPSGSNSFTKETPAVGIGFTHKLSKLTVKFTVEDDVDVDLKGATVNIVNTLPSTTLKVVDGTLGAASGTAAAIKAAVFASDATEFLSSALIVPQTVVAGNFIQVVLSDRILNATLSEDTVFASGKAYTYNVKLSKEKIEIQTSGTISDWDDNTDELSGDVGAEELPEPEPITLTATFGTPGGNATYSAPTYTWTGSTNNLMPVFEFANGELANYHTLKFTFSNLVDGPVRMGYYVGSSFTEFGNGFYSAGEKTVDLTALGIDLSTVTKIAFGGKSSAGSCDILASDVILIGNADGSTTGDDDTLTAKFGTPGGNATYSAPTYTWTGSTNNLMPVFEFANGELANYTKLTFTFSNLENGPVRMGYYVGSSFTGFNSNGYYSAGTKEVDLTALGIDLSTVTKIAFGGNSGAGSCDILASDVILSK